MRRTVYIDGVVYHAETPAELTETQLRVARMLASGLSPKRICTVLGIGVQQVRRHVAECRRRLDADNNIELGAMLSRRGLV